MIPLMKDRYTEKGRGWITTDELAEIVALAQSAPGAMVVNATSLLGYKLLGFWGAVVAVLGTALPPVIMLSIISIFYETIRDNRYVSAMFKGMRAGVAAVIADTVVTMAAPYFKKNKVVYVLVMVAAFVAAWFFSVNVAFVIIASGILGLLIGVVQRKREVKL